MENYMHNILEYDDPDIIECKEEYNEALIHNKEVQILHETTEGINNPIKKVIDDKIDANKLKEMKRNYYPNSEQIFNTT